MQAKVRNKLRSFREAVGGVTILLLLVPRVQLKHASSEFNLDPSVKNQSLTKNIMNKNNYSGCGRAHATHK